MSVCTICRFQIVDNSTTVCPNCGAPVESKPADDEYDSESEKVSSDEANDYSTDNAIPHTSGDDSLEICDPGDLLCQGDSDDSEPENVSNEPGQPIGESAPHVPRDEYQDEEISEDTSSIRKLSEEQVKNIRSDLLNAKEDEYVTPDDAANMMNDLTTNGEDSGPIEIPDSPRGTGKIDKPENYLYNTDISLTKKPGEKEDAPVTESAPPMRRVAYFHKNYIQLTGPFNPNAGEELAIGDRYYLLKPKKIKTQYSYAAFAVMLVIILFLIGKQFVSPTMPGQGTIIGMILDEQNNPYINGIEIRIPETGKKVKTDPEGFFHFEDISPGVYMLSYTLADGTIINETISVVDGQITMLTVGGEELSSHAAQRAQAEKRKSNYASAKSSQKKATQPPVKKEATKKSSKSTTAKYASVKLKANVKNARLMMSGKVLGIGNLTFKKLKPGKHNAMVSKEGYKPWKGKVTLKKGNTYALNVKLEKLTQASQATKPQPQPEEPTYSANDFYQSGQTMLTEGNALAAIGDFTEAIKLSPSMADAYFSRARANQILGKKSDAVNDYVRAGEIYTVQKRSGQAFEMFEKALDLNSKSISAMLNMGFYYQAKGNKSEALRQFKNVLRQDKNNFRANLESGKIYFAMGKNRDADKKLKKAKEINPRDPKVYHYLMLNYFARDDFSKVKDTYASFKTNTSERDVDDFRSNMKYDAILRIVGEYDRP